MQKVLISIIGKGQFNKEKGGFDYQLTTYKLDNGIEKNSKLVSDILQEHLKPDIIYIVGTNESLWNVADEFLNSYEKIIIPYGKNSEEFWQIFEAFTKLDVENKDVYFDITHGFRSIPIFISTLLNFFSKVKNAQIKGIYYGIFEAKDKNGATPVINMLPFLEMNNFIDAFSIFKKYSDGRDIANIINKKFKEIPKEQKKNFGQIKQLSTELELYSKTIGLSAIDLYFKSINKIENKISKIDKIPKNLKAIEFLMKDFKNELNEYEGLNKKWEKDFKFAKLLFEKNRYAQSITVLRETILTYILEELNLDIYNEDLREKKLGKIIIEDSENINKKLDTKYLNKELIVIIQGIKEIRNKTNHAFIKRSVGEKEIKNIVENLKNYIKELEQILYSDDTIKDEINLKLAFKLL